MAKIVYTGTSPIPRPIKFLIPDTFPRPIIWQRARKPKVRRAFLGASVRISPESLKETLIAIKKSPKVSDNVKKIWEQHLGRRGLTTQYMVFKGTWQNKLNPWIIYLYFPPGFTFDSLDSPHVAELIGGTYEMRGAVGEPFFTAQMPPWPEFLAQIKRKREAPLTRLELRKLKQLWRRKRKIHIAKFLWMPYIEGRGFPLPGEANILTIHQAAIIGTQEITKRISKTIASNVSLEAQAKSNRLLIRSFEETIHKQDDLLLGASIAQTISSEQIATARTPFTPPAPPRYPGSIFPTLPPPERKPPEPSKKSAPVTIILAAWFFGSIILLVAGIWDYVTSVNPPQGVQIVPRLGILVIGGIMLIVGFFAWLFTSISESRRLDKQKAEEDETKAKLKEKQSTLGMEGPRVEQTATD